MNNISYFEIQAADTARAIDFYSQIFGWAFTLDPTIPEEYYRIEWSGMMGGLLRRPPGLEPATRGTVNGFMCSVHVESYDRAAQSIIEHGGINIIPKMTIPGKCYQWYFLDTEKNVFGIFEVDEHAL